MLRFLLTLLLTSQLAPVASAKNMYIPAAGLTPGRNGTFWRTDLRIHNPSVTEDITVTLHFLPQGEDGRNIPGRAFHIGRRGTLVLDNVVGTLAPHLTSAVGAIRIDSDAHVSFEFIASSRTYTTSPDPTRPGTYGQFVPAFDASEGRTKTAVLHVSSTPEFRTNLGVMNPGGHAATLTFTLLGVDGQPFLSSAEQTVLPKSMRQWSLAELFGGLFAADAVVLVESSLPLFTFGSLIDNRSGDSVFVPGVASGPLD